ncbi:MAG: flagellar export chaperone FliS [Planctomycetes bacterium]|nr:flagellar export chaperone FliS [Planctomycetota bacterium]
MNPQSAAQAYRQSSFENAPPIKIVCLLYDGALRYIDRASSLLAAGHQPTWSYWIGRADAIVEELRLSLDSTQGGDLCRELDRLYDFVQSRLSLAVAEKDAAYLAEARRILVNLSEGWNRIETQTIGAPRA